MPASLCHRCVGSQTVAATLEPPTALPRGSCGDRSSHLGRAEHHQLPGRDRDTSCSTQAVTPGRWVHYQSLLVPQIPQAAGGQAVEMEVVNETQSLFLCPNAHRELSLGSPRCVNAQPERIQRGFGHPVHKAPTLVPKTTTAAQATGDLICGDMR